MATNPTITLAGSILTAEKLEHLERPETPGQQSADFGFRAGTRVRDEILRAWEDARNLWQVFQSRRARLPEGASGTSETRRYWVEPLLALLGYDNLKYAGSAEVIRGETYAISHRDAGGLPVHIAGCNQLLNSPTGTGRRLSPHDLVQEYLNVSGHLYGIVTNGLRLRLLRDAALLNRLSYIEFDLEGMMEERVYADFAIFYRLLHRSRLPRSTDDVDSCLLERYHQDAIEEGSAIRDRLSEALKVGIRDLANALLTRPENTALRQFIQEERLTDLQFYNVLLRLVYRLLFLLVTEARDLLYTRDFTGKTVNGTPYRELYKRFYSLTRLRALVEQPHLVDTRRTDLWLSLFDTFRLFERDEDARRLGLSALDGELFSRNALEDLEGTTVDNETVLKVLRRLFLFQNTRGVWTRVSFRSLNVEEFGSVYEGLLELAPVVTRGQQTEDGVGWSFGFREGTERSRTGTHYTPDDLVRPLIDHALEPVIADALKKESERLGIKNLADLTQLTEDQREVLAKAVLNLKVCDPACGSGHFLLAAGRRLAWHVARIRTGEEYHPEAQREAFREVAGQCLYGVDINPMAVELCKVAIWLEAHTPGRPLSFLDHRIKVGDALVGLAREEELDSGIPEAAFKAVDGDDRKVASALLKKHKAERAAQRVGDGVQLVLEDGLETNLEGLRKTALRFEALPDGTIPLRQAKEQAFHALEEKKVRPKNVADTALAPFFTPKQVDTVGVLLTQGAWHLYRTGRRKPDGRITAHADAIASKRRFFHWFLEFPEVFERGGFDCILGNPPFLGGQKISGSFGKGYLEWLKLEYAPAGAMDIVGFFFRRAFTLLSDGGFLGLIATNTIAQGGTREGGLAVILDRGGSINFAVPSMKWPGAAAVEVGLVTIRKGTWRGERLLSGRNVPFINSYLGDEEAAGDPFRLRENADKSFQGSIVLGQGFVLAPADARRLIALDPRNREVVFPYLNGDDLNSRPDQSPSRWVINFHDWPLERARTYPEPFRIVEELVKPGRIKNRYSPAARKYWWLYERARPELYRTIAPLERVLVVAQVSKSIAFAMVPTGQVFAMMAIVFPFDSYYHFTILQSNHHRAWVEKYASKLKNDQRYTPSDCFETYPFPRPTTEQAEDLERLGEDYHTLRASIMQRLQLGLTKTYNLFHTPGLLKADVIRAAKCGEETASDMIEALERLRVLHKEMDEAVRDAYGWSDLDLGHDFHEVDFLPENDRIRYTISPEARKEVLRRLLKLNHERYAEEQGVKMKEKVPV